MIDKYDLNNLSELRKLKGDDYILTRFSLGKLSTLLRKGYHFCSFCRILVKDDTYCPICGRRMRISTLKSVKYKEYRL